MVLHPNRRRDPTILTVLGARPQFIKAAVVSEALHAERIAEVIVHTGQHYDADMSEVFFQELGLREPKYNLAVRSDSHGRQTGRMLSALEGVVEQEKPDWVLVYGDTNSTLAGALVAAKMNIALAHVEAGLRSFNRRMPEEVNRLVADTLSDVLFVPTIRARDNLLHEGIETRRIFHVGDVMFDVALSQSQRAKAESTILASLGIDEGEYILATIHRAENTDDRARLQVILSALDEVSKKLPVILPLHPRTAACMERWGIAVSSNGALRVILPVGYLDMVRLELSAAAIVTDSGGVQKEAFFHKVPCVTVRAETEWTELVDLGWNRLAPPISTATLVNAVMEALGTRGEESKPYGAGDAASKIARVLASTNPV